MSTKKSAGKKKPPFSADELDELIGRVKEGDVDAFRRVYDVYGKRIVNYVYRLTGSRAEAEDLTQDTFVQAFRKIKSLKDNRKFQSWLFRIAQNNVYQQYRGTRPHLQSIDQEDAMELSDVQKLATPSKNPEQSILAGELKDVIDRLVNELPVKYREVFVLAAIQRMSYQEISETVGRSLASVKSDIHRARIFVRDRVKDYLGENYGMSDLL